MSRIVRRLTVPVVVVVMLTSLAQGADEKDLHKIPEPAKATLEKAEDFELLSLDPGTGKEAPQGDFHGWKVLGKTTVKDAKVRKELVDAFVKGVAEYKDGPAKCFDPRHGIRVTRKGTIVEFVICFECSQTRVYGGGVNGQLFLVSGSPTEVFNKVLRDAKVPLPKQAGDK
jgi:hypothetical protein